MKFKPVTTIAYVISFIGFFVGSIVIEACRGPMADGAKSLMVATRLNEALSYFIHPEMLRAVLKTFIVFAGTGLCTLVAGLLLALALYSSRLASIVLEPIVQIMRPIPSIATIALATIVLSTSSDMLGIGVAFIGSLWPFSIAALDAFRRVPQALQDSTVTLGKGDQVFFRQVLFLAALPGLFSAIRLVAPITLLLTVTTQYFYQHLGGLGALLYMTHNGMEYPKVISIITVLALMSIVIEYGVLLTERHICKWKTEPSYAIRA